MKNQETRQVTHVNFGAVLTLKLYFIYLLGNVEQKIYFFVCEQVISLMTKNDFVIFLGQVIKVNFSEPIQKRLRECLTTTSLSSTLTRILTSKYEEIWMADEFLV